MSKTILIVDDEEEIQTLAKTILAAEGYNVVLAKSGYEALQKMDMQSFDLLITDYNMPRFDGGKLVAEVRRTAKNKNLPIVLISGQITREAAPKFKKLIYLEKPFGKEKLLAVVDRFLNPGAKKFLLDVGVINAFVASAEKIMSSFGVTDLQTRPLRKKEGEGVCGDISSVVAISSPFFSGQLCISFEEKCFLSIVSKMLMEEYTQIDDENKDAVAEINNMILGNAKKDLQKYEIEKAIPNIITGKGHQISHKRGTVGMEIPFATPDGNFFIEVIAEPV